MTRTKVLSVPDVSKQYYPDPAQILQAIVGDAGKYAGDVGGAFGFMGAKYGKMGEDGEELDGERLLNEFWDPSDYFRAEDFFDPQSIVDEAFDF
jgi:hypothetical protein